MSHWNYRILHYREGGYGLHEVYYDDDGKPNGWTSEPCGFTADEDNPNFRARPWMAIGEALSMAFRDATNRPALEEADLERDTGPEQETGTVNEVG